MSSKLPLLFTLTGTGKPLDLSVKKTEMDLPAQHTLNTQHPSFSSKTPMRSSSLPKLLDILKTNTEQKPVFGETMHSDHQSFYSLASRSDFEGGKSHSSPVSLSDGHYVESPRPSVSPNFDDESGIVPKKRKNLWRPYDSQTKMDETDKDSDSSDSNLSSDHEFRVPLTPSPPCDPIKKRKFDMLRYADKQKPDIDERRSHSPMNHSMFMKDDVMEEEGIGYTKMESDQIQAGFSETLAKAQMSLISNFPESREKIISGMKKRDIFGWSLKLGEGADNTETVTETEPSQNTVCTDGEKTYFELQTVKKSPKSADGASVGSNKLEACNTVKPSERSQLSLQQDSSPGRLSSQSPHMRSQKINESNDSLVGKRVFIYGKDNAVETQDESKNATNKKSDTYKGLSLIDLIEEIEADALKEDKVQSEKERQIKNKRVAALLKQCNHVKLTALDFLMSNVLIEDNEQKRNTKNANIQKVLNGDNTNSLSMLDVMEMQVEVGLS